MFHRRKHIRLYDFDYSSGNAYFITICVKDFAMQLGEIRNGIMGLSEIGKTASVYLQKIPEIRKEVVLDEYIIMPSHVHFIMEIITSKHLLQEQKENRFAQPIAGSVSAIVNQYKGAVTKWCKNNDFPDFEWQGRFHDHVIRDQQSHETIRDYIISNPANWNKVSVGLCL